MRRQAPCGRKRRCVDGQLHRAKLDLWISQANRQGFADSPGDCTIAFDRGCASRVAWRRYSLPRVIAWGSNGFVRRRERLGVDGNEHESTGDGMPSDGETGGEED